MRWSGASALLRNIQNIRICMRKKPIVSVTYENERISIKNSLPYRKCVTSLLCGPRTDLWPFYGFLCKRFSLYFRVTQYYWDKKLLVITEVAIALLFSITECKYSAVVRNSTSHRVVDPWTRKSCCYTFTQWKCICGLYIDTNHLPCNHFWSDVLF